MILPRYKSLVIVGGGYTDESLLETILKGSVATCGVDSGCEAFLRIGHLPDMMIGDMDSIHPSSLEKLRESGVKYYPFPVMKDETDLELAIQLGIKLGYQKLLLLGCSGTRLDHTLGNLILLSKYKDYSIEFLDRNNKIYMMKQSFKISKESQYGKNISFFAFPDTVHQLTLKGFKYPLENYQLGVEDQLCISNEIIGDIGEVEFEGNLIVMETKD